MFGQRVMAVCWAIDPSVDVHTAATGLKGDVAEGMAAGNAMSQEQVQVGMQNVQLWAVIDAI